MARTHTKEAAEALLRELPSVVGAFVREDINGHPREVHLLIAPGPNPRHLARDVRDLLEERLGVPIDQRVISIAQLAVAPEDLDLDAASGTGTSVLAPEPEPMVTEPRLRFEALEAQTRGSTVVVRVHLRLNDRTIIGEAAEVDVGRGRLRAAAAAALGAAALACDQRLRFQLDGLTTVRAFGREYALVNVLVSAPSLGRKPVALAGAQPLEDEPDHAAALAALMAINRLIGRVMDG
ncbi:MAG: hypothetical protein ACRENP_07870 [Longimicrobiales bacterium]